MTGKDLFTREIDEALLRGAIDLAVHSLKDLPSRLPAGLGIVAVPAREDPSDVLISRAGEPLSALAPGSRIGSSSPRRRGAAPRRAPRPRRIRRAGQRRHATATAFGGAMGCDRARPGGPRAARTARRGERDPFGVRDASGDRTGSARRRRAGGSGRVAGARRLARSRALASGGGRREGASRPPRGGLPGAGGRSRAPPGGPASPERRRVRARTARELSDRRRSERRRSRGSWGGKSAGASSTSGPRTCSPSPARREAAPPRPPIGGAAVHRRPRPRARPSRESNARGRVAGAGRALRRLRPRDLHERGGCRAIPGARRPCRPPLRTSRCSRRGTGDGGAPRAERISQRPRRRGLRAFVARKPPGSTRRNARAPSPRRRRRRRASARARRARRGGRAADALPQGGADSTTRRSTTRSPTGRPRCSSPHPPPRRGGFSKGRRPHPLRLLRATPAIALGEPTEQALLSRGTRRVVDRTPADLRIRGPARRPPCRGRSAGIDSAGVTGFPTIRLRRLRRTPALRSLVRETRLSADRFVAPLFVRLGSGKREEILSLPGVFRLSPDEAVAEAQALAAVGVGPSSFSESRTTRTTSAARRGTTPPRCRRRCAG